MQFCGRQRESWWCWSPVKEPASRSAPASSPRSGGGGDSGPASLGANGAETEQLPSVLRKIEKWGDYAAVGQVIACKGGAGLIPMKTPLTWAQMSRLVDSGKRVTHPHTLKAFIASQQTLGRRVGLIVDLTQHDCLYGDELAAVPSARRGRPTYVPTRDDFKVQSPHCVAITRSRPSKRAAHLGSNSYGARDPPLEAVRPLGLPRLGGSLERRRETVCRPGRCGTSTSRLPRKSSWSPGSFVASQRRPPAGPRRACFDATSRPGSRSSQIDGRRTRSHPTRP